MSRFCFCNCPAGFSADPERHAPDCPGRSGAGKARTPVPATTPALKVSASEELDAVLHWRGKHAQAIKERDALQQRLTAADERADVLGGLLSNAYETAAKWVEKRCDAYVDEHGSRDPETGTVEFPGDGEEYVGELMEIADGLRALKPAEVRCNIPACDYQIDMDQN